MKALVVDGYTTNLPNPTVTYPGRFLQQLVVPDLGVVVTPYMGVFYVSKDVKKVLDLVEKYPNSHNGREIELDADVVSAIEAYLDSRRLLEANLVTAQAAIAEHFAPHYWYGIEREDAAG